MTALEQRSKAIHGEGMLVQVDREAEFRKSVQWGIARGLLRWPMTVISPPAAKGRPGLVDSAKRVLDKPILP